MSKSQDAFRTISEVADWLETPAHVLRFWESRFTQVKPVKRAGGRRYYRPADMELLSGIKKLLHEDGMTIKGVQKLLRAEGIKHVAALGLPMDDLGIDIPPAQTERTADEILEATRSAASFVPNPAPPAEEIAPTNQVISFPKPPEVPDEAPEEIPDDAPEEIPDETPDTPPENPEVLPVQTVNEPPLQASFLDDIPEVGSVSAPEDSVPDEVVALEPASFDATDDTSNIELETEFAEESEGNVESYAEEESLVSEVIAQDPPTEPDMTTATDEAEGIDPIVPASQEPVALPPEITSVSQLSLPDPSEIPEVSGGYSAFHADDLEEDTQVSEQSETPTPEPLQTSDIEGTPETSVEDNVFDAAYPEPDDSPSEEDLNDLAALDIPKFDSPTSLQETSVEPEPENIPLEASSDEGESADPATHVTLETTPEFSPEIPSHVESEATEDTPVEVTPEPTFSASQDPEQTDDTAVDAIETSSFQAASAPLPEDETTFDPEPDIENDPEAAMETAEVTTEIAHGDITDDSAEEVTEGTTESVPIEETTPEPEEQSLEPAVAPIHQEDATAPSQNAPVQDSAPSDIPNEADSTEDDAPGVVVTTSRHRLTRRAAPFSADKKSELAELTARLSALRKTYGTVSKPSLKI
ncbi:MerR family transcriptional regulator [Falsihalocynthiibacter sp. BN13B15]|uniref:MerR family transcriptional regulator n=1 Tax=Falsihalocynthiibacter sp. BN13B15 TaxID=3240871 RepID=UPI00350FE4EF